ncbi:MAG TPA: flagellar hook-associated protein 3 [Gammaproteobacteria bacterium]|nr:flagellar hook-associated protein 3 [Gammaproteobacteria bacterium]
MRIASNQFFELNVSALQQQESRVRTTQLQLTKGEKFLSPADDPAGATRILGLEQRLASLEQYDRNLNLLENQLGIEETAVAEINDLLDDARESLIDANNGTHTEADYRTFADSLAHIRDQLFNLGNRRDSNGEFMFAGTASKTQPFIKDSVNGYQYQGDQNTREVAVAASRTIRYGDSGYDLFVDNFTGKDGITASASAINSGSGIIGSVSETAPGAYNGDHLQVVFTAPGVYDLVNATTSTTLASGLTYQNGDTITVNGVAATFSGEPEAGDQFDFQPSTRQNLMTTIDTLVAALQNAQVENTAPLGNVINRGLENLDTALDQTNVIRARVGNRLNAVTAVRDANEGFEISYQTTLSEIKDLDFAEAAARLNSEASALEIAQAAFARVQNLSLFNFL